ncbi:unnamed protein product [Sphenostylis stenocarpa]|uniref:non-specific serine/threonine protein kinase n=1 Tax=Sphenostylis stenocarpa TaxID=92480 RepID=A0AA86VAA2_9FABA|nr:unnamed protein product [Sphenostylis stenocarpa]
MGSIGTSDGNCKGGRKNKDVAQGNSENGSTFWEKLRFFLGCLLFSSKGEGSSIDKSKQGEGRNVEKKRSSSTSESQEFIKSSSNLRRFTFHDIQLATKNFDSTNFLGRGGFGTVFKGWVDEIGNYAETGTRIPVAVKTLNPNGFQGHKQWLAEIKYLGELHHPNLVRLVGYCMEEDKRVLAYEFMCRGSLEKYLFQRGTTRLPWSIRMKIAMDAANGLTFLHEEASLAVIFRDFKTSNILLDKAFNAKLSDFGFAKDAPVGDKTHISTEVMGTEGYIAPEYVMTGHLTSKSDVYSFGMVLLEMLTGRRAVDQRRPTKEKNLVDWLRPRIRRKENFHQVMDPRFEGQYPVKQAYRAMRLAIHCLRLDPETRPLMSDVVRELQSLLAHDDDMPSGPSTSSPSPSIPSLPRIHVGPSNHAGVNKYGLRTGPAPNKLGMRLQWFTEFSAHCIQRAVFTKKCVWFSNGRNCRNDIDRNDVIAQRSSSTGKLSNYARSSPLDQKLIVASLLLRRFTFHDLMLATRSFKVENFFDEEGFGILLKGWINPYGNYAARPGTGIPIAVKALNFNRLQHHNEWLDEIIYLSELHHLNLVKLVGFCLEDEKMLLVYEHMSEGSLEKHLFKTGTRFLTWPTRMKIAISAANGMAFLHEEASRPLIFRDFNTSSILLEKDYNTKLWDFGFAKDAPVTSKVVGSKGYEAPEYVMTGQLTSKSNVYSFGLVLLELLTGRRVIDETMPLEEQNLMKWLGPRVRNKANFHYLMDPRLEGQYPTKFAHRTMRLAVQCLRLDPKTRPLMSEVVRELKSLHDQDASVSVPSTSLGRMHIGSSNHGSATKYGLGIGSSSNVPRCFQDYPLPLPPPLPPPPLRPSSKS